MELPGYQPFYLPDLDALEAEIARVGVEIPVARDATPLTQPFTCAGHPFPNHFCAQPLTGFDGTPGGAPGPLTHRRYQRLAAGGFGLIWFEQTAATAPAGKSGLLCLSEATLAAFTALVSAVRAAAPAPPLLILQLTAANAAALVEGARLAQAAGFDGVDVQGGHALCLEGLAGMRTQTPTLLRASRVCAFEAVRGGFGVSAVDFRQTDPGMLLALVERLVGNGLQLLNLTAASPRLRGPERGARAIPDHGAPEEHPLMTLARQIAACRTVRADFPLLPLVGSGWGWLRHLAPNVAAATVGSGEMDWAGFGRGALACPDLPLRVGRGGGLDQAATCMVCFACTRLADEQQNVGCVVRDADTYGPVYTGMRRFDADRLLAGAMRCLGCEAAPCVAASPVGMDIPAFLRAYREGREADAYAVIRAANPLPELSALTAPAWLEEEGMCVEKALSGSPVPISDLQYAIAWQARARGASGVRIPERATGRQVAVVGGGPTGVAAAVRLLELGHSVHLYESTERLGGVPVRALARTRSLTESGAEIDTLLRPALEASRLHLRFGAILGGDLRLGNLLRTFDAVLVATGLWRERSLGSGSGVVGALDVLEHGLSGPPGRVALLAGGDSAMDAARLLRSAGASDIFVIFGGPRAEMHWHMSEEWFAQPGVHAMMEWLPQRYEWGGTGRLAALHLRHTRLGVEARLAVDLVVEAMGLLPEEAVLEELGTASARVFTAGALVNGGTSVGHCIAEGLASAMAIHARLSQTPLP